MQWSEEQKQKFRSGEHLLWRDNGNRSCTLLFVANGTCWEFSLDQRHAISWARELPESQASRFLPTQLSKGDHVVPFDEVPDNLGLRCKRLIEDLAVLEPKYEAGAAWVPSGNYYLTKHPVLGGLFVNPTTKRIATRVYARTELLQWLWEHPGAFPGDLPAETLAPIAPLLSEYSSVIAQLRTGAVLLALGDKQRGYVLHCHHRFLRLLGLEAQQLEELLFNPYIATLSIDRLVDWLVENPGYQLTPLPDVLRALEARIAEELARPKTEIVERYMQRIRKGGSISGGPTTDQSWTIRYDGKQFTISGYRPTDDGGYEQTLDPIAEDEVRRMISSYRMFGLNE